MEKTEKVMWFCLKNHRDKNYITYIPHERQLKK